jgi:hypothetical protein
MVTSRSVPQQTEQIVSALAGQNRFALRFWQIGQVNLDTPSSKELYDYPAPKDNTQSG